MDCLCSTIDNLISLFKRQYCPGNVGQNLFFDQQERQSKVFFTDMALIYSSHST